MSVFLQRDSFKELTKKKANYLVSRTLVFLKLTLSKGTS